jgi:RHH-type rel operon transcriptional repressor/antitoxin RelB
MLGVRLDTELEERLAAVARTQGRSKSDIAREAVRRYVDLHDEAYRREARRQSMRASKREGVPHPHWDMVGSGDATWS